MPQHRYAVFALALLVSIFFTDFAYAETAQKKEKKYWAGLYIVLSDYDYLSGDTEFLQLEKNSEKFLQFKKELTRIFIQNKKDTLPFYNYAETKSDFLRQTFFKNIQDSDAQKQFADMIVQKHGDGAACAAIFIQIKGRSVPILYEIIIKYGIGENLYPTTRINSTIGYSTPESLLPDIKKEVITLIQTGFFPQKL
ncbi:MAG: hypothetical protein QM795_15690 [Pseudoxanthomonas sp.]